MIQEQLAHLPEFLPDYRPFPPVKEHTAWQGLPLRAKQRFLQAGEAALQTPIAPLPLSLWLDFTHRSGWISPTLGGARHGRRLTSPAGRGCARW